jgi:glucose/arabinose dehydrogenase
LLLVICASAIAVLAPVSTQAAPPVDFQASLVVGSGLDGPSGFEIAPDGRIFVLERAGKIKIIKNGQLLAEPFADLPSEASGDRGLIGIAFHPDFGLSNHYVYFYYTGHDLLNHLVRFNAATDVGTDGPFTVFQTQSPSQLLHVGGSIRFGPDGKLYFAVGDNGYPPNAQDLSNPHGKILRINADGTVPTDNPFYGQPGKLGAIWAYGFRNPWRFQFDAATGNLYGGDVGDYTWEELNHIVKGGNYGWPVNEGMCISTCAGYLNPIHAYNHDGTTGAVTGGPVYRASMFPEEYRGSLFFGDYSRGFIKRATLNADGTVAAVNDFDATAGSVVDLKVAPDGSLYYLTYYPGALYRISYDTTSHAPIANASADATKGVEPFTVHFSSNGTSDPDGDPLSYQWTVGVYTAQFTVSDGVLQTPATPIVIQVGLPPTLTVVTPVEDALYRAGDVITYNAFASDAAGFDINDANIKTNVLLHHNVHVHPFVGPLTGRVGSFTIPTTGEASADTWFEVIVTATDANGLSATKTVNIRPRKVTLTLATSPAGLGISLDGVPVPTPHVVGGVVGFKRELSAPPTALSADGTVYHFTGWSDGKAIRHFITTLSADTTYTATYEPSAPFTGEYFNNMTLDGTPALVRPDPEVDFVLSVASPGPGVQPDFSARWTKTEFLAAGRYRFTTATDDGVRLFLNNQLVINEWHDQGPTAYSYVTDLPAGNLSIRMEFYDSGVDAVAKLSWETTADQPSDMFTAQYWNTPGAGTAPTIPSGAANLTRDEEVVNYNWGEGSPAPGIGPDHFVARWSRVVALAAGQYEFTATGDDGVRLFVDGQRVVDKWLDQGPTAYTATLTLASGPHTVVMDYYDNGAGAVAKLEWVKTADPPPLEDYLAEYWNTPGAGSGPAMPARVPDLTRTEARIDVDWGGGSPAASINVDRFVARWTRTDLLPAGLYRFSGASDDGIRVYVDNELVVDKWRDQNEPFSGDKILLGGVHTIRVEYYEGAAEALIRFGYQRVGDITPPAGFEAAYFIGTELEGTPVLVRQDSAIDFDWGFGSPDPAAPADGFSVRWTKTDSYAAGTYRVVATADDGIRVFIDGAVVLDGWSDHPPTTYTTDLALAAGNHTVVVEYYDSGGGAVARTALTRL